MDIKRVEPNLLDLTNYVLSRVCTYLDIFSCINLRCSTSVLFKRMPDLAIHYRNTYKGSLTQCFYLAVSLNDAVVVRHLMLYKGDGISHSSWKYGLKDTCSSGHFESTHYLLSYYKYDNKTTTLAQRYAIKGNQLALAKTIYARNPVMTHTLLCEIFKGDNVEFTDWLLSLGVLTTKTVIEYTVLFNAKKVMRSMVRNERITPKRFIYYILWTKDITMEHIEMLKWLLVHNTEDLRSVFGIKGFSQKVMETYWYLTLVTDMVDNHNPMLPPNSNNVVSSLFNESTKRRKIDKE